jgi:hypothetical protein
MEQVNINVTKVEQDVTINATPNVTQIIVTTQNGGGTQNLNDVLSEGNETDGENIFISDGDEITFDNGSRIRKGLTDAGNGGAKGVALVCSLDYELKWEAGRQYVTQQDGFTIREVSHNFTITPSATDDSTKGFAIDSRWILDNGDVYVCTDATEDSAVWELQVIGGAVDSVNGKTGVVVLDADDIDDTSTTNKFTTATDISKLAGIEANADVTDSTNVNAAGAVMNSDYSSHSILVQQSGSGSPTSLGIGNNTLIGRLSGGGSDINDLSVSQVKGLLNFTTPTDVQTIADAKVTNAIVDGVTTIAPSQNAVFDALDLKQNNLGYIPLPTNAGTATGATLSFVTDRIYGTIASPVTGNITADVTGAQLGVTNIIIHNSGTAPTFSSEYKKLSGSGNYIVSVVNYIYCTFITSTEIIYSINQRT